MTDTIQNIITLGTIGRPHALKGWMRLNSFTNPIENIFSYGQLYIESKNKWLPFSIENHELRDSQILIKFKDANTPEEARKYTNANIGIYKDQLPELPEGEYYWSDLIGLTVINKAGVTLGEVDHLFETGANDIIVVKGTKEHLLPYIDDTVLSIDIENKEMTVDWD